MSNYSVFQGRACRYPVEGSRFDSVKALYRAAVSRGYEGGFSTFARRVRDGASTWAALTASPGKQRVGGLRGGRSRYEQSKREVAEAIAALDARKGSMA